MPNGEPPTGRGVVEIDPVTGQKYTIGRHGVRLPIGRHPGNTGGKKGRSGRKPDWLKRFCDKLLATKKTREQVRAVLEDKDHPAFAAMWRAVADRAHGKPAQSIDVTSNGLTLEALVASSWVRSDS